MDKKKQTMRFTDEELSIIKSTFAEEQELLFAVRKLFLQMPLNAIDQSYLNVFKGNADLMHVMRKTFLPELEAEAPINQEVDLIMTLKLEDKSAEQAFPHILARSILMDYLDEQLQRLNGANITPTIEFAVLSELPKVTDPRSMWNADELYARVTARNMLVQHVEMQLNQLNVLGGMKTEDVEATKARLHKDSSK